MGGLFGKKPKGPKGPKGAAAWWETYRQTRERVPTSARDYNLGRRHVAPLEQHEQQ